MFYHLQHNNSFANFIQQEHIKIKLTKSISFILLKKKMIFKW